MIFFPCAPIGPHFDLQFCDPSSGTPDHTTVARGTCFLTGDFGKAQFVTILPKIRGVGWGPVCPYLQDTRKIMNTVESSVIGPNTTIFTMVILLALLLLLCVVSLMEVLVKRDV